MPFFPVFQKSHERIFDKFEHKGNNYSIAFNAFYQIPYLDLESEKIITENTIKVNELSTQDIKRFINILYNHFFSSKKTHYPKILEEKIKSQIDSSLEILDEKDQIVNKYINRTSKLWWKYLIPKIIKEDVFGKMELKAKSNTMHLPNVLNINHPNDEKYGIDIYLSTTKLLSLYMEDKTHLYDCYVSLGEGLSIKCKENHHQAYNRCILKKDFAQSLEQTLIKEEILIK